MKKLIVMTLLAAMILSLCGCAAGSGKKPDTSFQVGYAREDITPMKPTPLGGYGNASQRLSTEFLDYLYVTCIAITDSAGNTLMLVSQDLIRSSQYKAVRSEVKKATGIPEGNIMVAATHSHSTPDPDNAGSSAWDVQYKSAIAKAAAAAMADRSPAEISIGSAVVENMNFVRHYLLDNGTYAGSNFGDFESGNIVDHAEETDPGLQVVRFIRPAEDKKDIIMANWQAHPTMTGGSNETKLSADFIGPTRSYVEQQTGQLFVYFTGAAGNLVTGSKIEGEAPKRDYNQYGQELGGQIVKVLENMTPVEAGEIKNTELFFDAKVNHEQESNIAQAREVVNLLSTTDLTTATAQAKAYGFSSVYQCKGIINRASFGETYGFNINAISIGNLSFIAAPYEMFACHGTYIKENTPFDMTFIMTCCNGDNSYIPSEKAHNYSCYESHTGRYTAETGDEVTEAFMNILAELKG